jgi:large subunit ribosomal protein L21
MYAIIETGGKQLRVEKDDIIEVERLKDEKEGPIEFKNVLFLSREGSVKVGTPYIAKAAVKGELLGEIKGPKVVAFKYKQRKGIRRKVGHRQKYSQVKITEIIG